MAYQVQGVISVFGLKVALNTITLDSAKYDIETLRNVQ